MMIHTLTIANTEVAQDVDVTPDVIQDLIFALYDREHLRTKFGRRDAANQQMVDALAHIRRTLLAFSDDCSLGLHMPAPLPFASEDDG